MSSGYFYCIVIEVESDTESRHLKYKMLVANMRKFLVAVFACYCMVANAQKQVLIPTEFSTDPALKTWSYSRSAQSENFVCFWGALVGNDPSVYANADLRFTPCVVLDTLEKIYTKFIKEIKFCDDNPETNLGKYKIIIVMNNTWPAGGPEGWAFGGSYDDKIGAMWVHPNATRDGGVTSHELTHSLQAQNYIDKNNAGGFRDESAGFFWETHANFMRSQMYPVFVKDDMARWMATSSYHWSSTRHHYDAFMLLYAIQELDGINMVNRLWQESLAAEHPLMTYRRLKGWTQNQLNDFIYEYAKRQVTADFNVNNAGAIISAERKRLATNEPHFLWRQYTLLDRSSTNAERYAVPGDLSPQDYGYNVIPLYTTCENREVQVKFKGHTEAGTSAGWRYGFAAVKADGSTTRYSQLYSANEAEISFQMQQDEERLYLVVTGAPTAHTTYPWEAGFPKIKRFPYELTIHNAVPEGFQENYREVYKTAGTKHANGGGWVSNASVVAASVFVGPNAIIRPGCNISGNVRVEGNAWVENASVKDNVIISGNANVFGGTISNNAVVTGNAIVNHCTISGNVVVKGNALEWGVSLSNAVTVGGDAEIGDCGTTGVYLQVPHPNNGRDQCDGKGADDPSNIEINNPVAAYADLQMAITNPFACTPKKIVENLALIAAASTSYVSPWETLSAVNDGYTPLSSNDKSNGAYGNWPNPNSFQWVQYDWPSNYILSKIDVYWFDDGGGVLTPSTAYVEYWDGSAWIKIGDVPLVKDGFNSLVVNSITTNRIRITMKNTDQSTGILEWRVWGYSPVLPVKLLSFSGQKTNGINMLQWKVAREENVNTYEIEYSTDATRFNKVGSVKASSMFIYWFNHNSNTPVSYYRLKQVDNDKNFVYSPIIKISSSILKDHIRLYNNPVVDNLMIAADLAQACKGVVTVIDISGREVIANAAVDFSNGFSIISIPANNLCPGSYLVNIRLESALENQVALRFIKK